MATPDDDGLATGPDMMAAELALGLLDGDERAAALRRLVGDPAFAAEVERWRDWFGALFAAWPAVEAPGHVADRIDATLDGRIGGGTVADFAARRGTDWRPLAIAAA